LDAPLLHDDALEIVRRIEALPADIRAHKDFAVYQVE